MKFIGFLFFLFFFLSCTSKQKVPAGVLPVPKMSAIMWQVMQADAVVNRRAMADTSLKRFDTSLLLYGQIFEAQTMQPRSRKDINVFAESRRLTARLGVQIPHPR